MANHLSPSPNIRGDIQPPLVWSSSGVNGAGFVNTIAIDPNSTGLVIAGGDVSGLQRSTDWGARWTPANGGATSTNHLRMAVVAFHPTVANKCYAGAGVDGNSGGFFRSTDGGVNWTLASTAAQFGGDNSNVAALPNTHPRSTGNLLAFDPLGTYIYAATFNDGVMRSSNDGNTWTVLGLAGKYLRSIAVDPDDPDTVYVSAYGDKVYKTTTARSTGTFTSLAASPTSTEDLIVINSVVYAAGGDLGVFKSTNGGTTWTQLGSGTLGLTTENWCSIDGYVSGGNTVLYVGCVSPTRDSTSVGFDVIYKSTNGGSTWTSMTHDLSKLHLTEGGPEGDVWWLSVASIFNCLGRGAGSVAAQLAVDRTDTNRIFSAGRGGIWGSSNAGVDWYPMVSGLGVTLNRAIIADPNVDGTVYVANTDWVFMASSDSLVHVEQNKTPVPGAASPLALQLALDTSTTPSTVYAAVGDRNNNVGGGIYRHANPLGTGSWVDTGFNAAVAAKRPLAVAVRQVSGSPVILAAVEAGGIWRKSGSVWSQVNATAMGAQTTKTACFAWPSGSSTVYLYDRASGVWRSGDNGATWTKIWAKLSNSDMTGWVAVDDLDPTTLFVSVNNDSIYRILNANSGLVGGTLVATSIGPLFTKPGPITARNGILYATNITSGTDDPIVMSSTNKGTSWTDITDTIYTIGARFPFMITAGADNALYVSLNGDGALRRPPPPA